MMKKNELESMFIRSNIDFIGLAAKFLYDKKCSCEVVRRLYELKGTNYDDISDKVALLMVEHVLAGLMRLHDEKLFENIKPKKKKKKKKKDEVDEDMEDI